MEELSDEDKVILERLIKAYADALPTSYSKEPASVHLDIAKAIFTALLVNTNDPAKN